MPDAIDAVDPDNIGPEWDGLPVLKASVLADHDGQMFDVEVGNDSPDANARAILWRTMQGFWSVGYTNEADYDAFTAALAALELRWLDADLWPQPGPYLWAASPGITPGTVPAWCPVTPVMVQDRWQQLVDLSTVFGPFPGRVTGYIDGMKSIWPTGAWSRFTTIADTGENVPLTPADVQLIVAALQPTLNTVATEQAELVATIQPELVQLTAYVKELIAQLDATVQPELVKLQQSVAALTPPAILKGQQATVTFD